MSPRKTVPSPDQGSFFTETFIHSGSDPESHTVSRHLEAAPEGVFGPEPVQSAPVMPVDSFAERNKYLKMIVQPEGDLSQIGKREGDKQLRQRGFTPGRLAEHRAQKGDQAPANYEYSEEYFKKHLASACGACALSKDCVLTDMPDNFRKHFYDSATRLKLLRRVTSDDSTKNNVKCDTIVPAPKRKTNSY